MTPRANISTVHRSEPECPLFAQRHSKTSVAAAKSMEPHVGTMQWRVLMMIRDAGERGMTDDEGTDLLDATANSFRPRRVALVRIGQVKDSGRVRLTKSERSAVVWIAQQEGPTA